MRATSITIAALAVMAFGTACDNSVGGNDSGRLTLLLTDAPGDFQEAVVTISSIYLQGDATSDNESGRVMLRTGPVTTDLLTLANDVATLVDAVEVPAGTYGQLRFVIDGAYVRIETETGSKVYATPGYSEAPAVVDGQLKCPSCGTSGIKVNLQGNLELDGTAETLLVDFDVSETFGHEAGNSGMWVMHPSIKASPMEEAASLDVSLGLAGGLTLPVLTSGAVTLGDFSAELKGASADPTVSGEIVNFMDTDGDGTFDANFANVVPGDYQLFLRAPAGLDFTANTAFPFDLTVDAAGALTESFTITGAAAAS
jgi:Domain of unknown function (DUF4382)